MAPPPPPPPPGPPLRGAVEHELQVPGVLAGGPAVRRAPQVVARDVAPDAPRQRLRVGEADACDLGRREDRLRDDRVVHRLHVALEGVQRRHAPLVRRGRRELLVARRVARPVDVRERRLAGGPPPAAVPAAGPAPVVFAPACWGAAPTRSATSCTPLRSRGRGPSSARRYA